MNSLDGHVLQSSAAVSKRRHIRRGVQSAALSVTLVASALAAGGPAAAAEAVLPACSHQTITASCMYTVPAGITGLSVTVNGAAGGDDAVSHGAHGGAGAQVKATVHVNPGDAIAVTVGTRGATSIISGAGHCNVTAAGGSPGGGTGGKGDTGSGGGGGGYSALTLQDGGSGTLLMLAGGGGGAAGINAGGAAGNADGSGHSGGYWGQSATAGGGATPTDSGIAGWPNGSAGASLQGGGGGCDNSVQPGQNSLAGGGGGGGYYGGGGGGGSWGTTSYGAGGGGSSYLNPDSSQVSDGTYSANSSVAAGSVTIIEKYTVPAGVNALRVNATGASGGSWSSQSGGEGAAVSSILTVSAGDVFDLYSGTAGSAGGLSGIWNAAGGTPGGGQGGWGTTVIRSGGAGGGLSGLMVGGTNTPVVVAGGGGGAAAGANGGSAGSNANGDGSDGSCCAVNASNGGAGGGGSTSSATGGTGGAKATGSTVGTTANGSPGTSLLGGAGGNTGETSSSPGGGGGGGGYFGGGGGGPGKAAGGNAGAGGGGSSYVDPTWGTGTIATASTTGDGSITVTPLNAPTVTGISPNHGLTSGGYSITLTGTDLDVVTGVTVGADTCTGVAWDPVSSTLSCTIPPGSYAGGAVDVVVSNPAGSVTDVGGFTFQTAPSITSVDVSGTATVGQELSASASGVSGSPTPTVSWQWQRSDNGTDWTDITSATLQSYTLGADDAGLYVRAQATAANGVDPAAIVTSAPTDLVAVVAPPVIDDVNPGKGPATGGTEITISGSGFDPSTASVSVGGVDCVLVNSPAATAVQLTCTTGTHDAGVVDVAVTNGDHQSGTLSGAFTYVDIPAATGPPAVAPAVTPAVPAPVAPIVTGMKFAKPDSIVVSIAADPGVTAVQYRTKIRGTTDYGPWKQVSNRSRVQIPVKTKAGTWVQIRTIGAGGPSPTVLLLVQASGISIEAKERGDVAGCTMPKLQNITYLKSGKARLTLASPAARCVRVRSTATAGKHYSAWKRVKKRAVISVELLKGKVGKLQIRAGSRIAKISLFIPRIV